MSFKTLGRISTRRRHAAVEAVVGGGMFADELRRFVMALKGAEETTPFGPSALVYKVGGKVFAIIGDLGAEAGEMRVNLKCEPGRALELREDYPGVVLPGYHMNKRHWNTVVFEAGIADGVLVSLVQDSYRLVVKGLPKKVRGRLGSTGEDPGVSGRGS